MLLYKVNIYMCLTRLDHRQNSKHQRELNILNIIIEEIVYTAGKVLQTMILVLLQV